MANYTFLDASSSVQTAQASVVAGTVLRPQVDVGSILSVVPVAITNVVGASLVGLIFGVDNTDGTQGSASANKVTTVDRNMVFSSVWVRQRGSETAGTIVTPYAFPSSFISGVTSMITGTAVTSIIAAAPSGQRNYITHLLITNQQTSVTGAGTQVNLIDDGSGQVMYAGYVVSGGGNLSMTFPTPLRQVTSAFSLSAKCITTASVIVAASGYIAT